jgi:hypothetical protein
MLIMRRAAHATRGRALGHSPYIPCNAVRFFFLVDAECGLAQWVLPPKRPEAPFYLIKGLK